MGNQEVEGVVTFASPVNQQEAVVLRGLLVE